MKKTLIISTIIIFVLLLVALWFYLLVNGTPKVVEENFGEFGNEGTEVVFEESPQNTEDEINLERKSLRQLTTKPVAGFREVININESFTEVKNEIYYAESGTGHIYVIDLVTGQEKRISGTTIPQTQKVVFSEDGKFVAFGSTGPGKEFDLVVGTLDAEFGLNMLEFSVSADDFTINENNELLYSKKTAENHQALLLDLENQSRKTVFTAPFREAKIIWDTGTSSSHYIQPLPSQHLFGALYAIQNGVLNRQKASGYGMSALATNNYILFNRVAENKILLNILEIKTGLIYNVEFPALVEKCIPYFISDYILCGLDALLGDELPDSWYRGEVGYSDRLALLNLKTKEWNVIVNTLTQTSRAIDVIDLQADSALGNILFKNKNDQTLWMYEI